MQLVAADEVERFTTFGYVVAATAPKPVLPPGTAVRLFGYTLDMRAIGNPNVITLTDKGYDGLTIGCSAFLGAARFQNAAGSKHMVVVDGLRYEMTGRARCASPEDVRTPPPADSLRT